MVGEVFIALNTAFSKPTEVLPCPGYPRAAWPRHSLGFGV